MHSSCRSDNSAEMCFRLRSRKWAAGFYFLGWMKTFPKEKKNIQQRHGSEWWYEMYQLQKKQSTEHELIERMPSLNHLWDTRLTKTQDLLVIIDCCIDYFYNSSIHYLVTVIAEKDMTCRSNPKCNSVSNKGVSGPKAETFSSHWGHGKSLHTGYFMNGYPRVLSCWPRWRKQRKDRNVTRTVCFWGYETLYLLTAAQSPSFIFLTWRNIVTIR